MHARRSRRTAEQLALILAAAFLADVVAGCRRATRALSPIANPEATAAQNSPRLPAIRTDGSGYRFTDAERMAVEEFLRRHPDLRIATDADRRGARSGDGDVRGLYGIYHPYFVRGDLNDDGVLDFVLAFVHRGSGKGLPWFSVVVFAGLPAGRGFAPGMFLEREISLARGDLSIDRDAILVTPDLSDEAVRRYRWDPVHRSYVFVRDNEPDDDLPTVSET